MTPARLTVSTMLGLIALAAVAMAALRSASPLWGVSLFVAQWLVLLWCVLKLWFSRGSARSTWIGALIFGLGALMATTPNLLLTQPSNTLSVALGEIFESLHPRPPQQYIPQSMDPAEMFRRQVDANVVNNGYYTRQNRFTAITTTLMVIAFTILGGFSGRAASWKAHGGVLPEAPAGYTEGKEGP